MSIEPIKAQRSVCSDKKEHYFITSPNGDFFLVQEEFSTNYGAFVARVHSLDCNERSYVLWACCNGLETLPKSLSFLLPHLKSYCNGTVKLIQPVLRFED